MLITALNDITQSDNRNVIELIIFLRTYLTESPSLRITDNPGLILMQDNSIS